LLDNDRVIADLMRHLEREVGEERQRRYWAIFEQLRAELGYADYLGALQRYRLEYPRDTLIESVVITAPSGPPRSPQEKYRRRLQGGA
jgi:hypothetical protein